MKRFVLLTCAALLGALVVLVPSSASASTSTIRMSPVSFLGQNFTGQTPVGQTDRATFHVGVNPLPSGTVSITGVDITGPNASDFTLLNDGCTGTTIGPGIDCQGTVQFAPSATGVRTATLTVHSDAANDPASQTISSIGGPVPRLCNIPSGTLDYGNVYIGRSSDPDDTSIPFRNCGLADLHISGVSVTRDSAFSMVTDQCTGATLPAGSFTRCWVITQFTPTTAGPASATLTISSDSFDSPTVIPLSGRGIADTDLGVVVSADPNPAKTHQGLDYKITVTNYGPFDEPAGANTIMGFFLYDGQGFIDMKPSVGCTTPAVGDAGGLICPLGPLAVGASVTFKIDVRVTAKPRGSVGGQAILQGSIADLNTNNNAVTLLVPVG
jgi:hypothetical protein